MLKKLFPKARFVHIRRNPYAVFASSRARLPRMIEAFSLNNDSGLDYDTLTLDSYRVLMKQYIEQRESIPPEDLFEATYEELVADPDKVVGDIYSKFGLDQSDESVRRHADYLGSQKSYQKNRHRLSRLQVERIRSDWKFVFNEWNYEIPPDLEIVD